MSDETCKWIWPFLAIAILHCIAILLFTRGFLLTRTELPFYSNCSDISQSPCISSNNEQCWTKPAVNRVVIIVLDALRFDFVAPSSCFEEKKPWMDRLEIIQKMAIENGTRARIFKAIADPPTTSLQRLKGLTTGGLPTFIDVGNSFGAPAIVEDNFLYQLAQNGKRVVMMGDDTWVRLFPHHFEKSYPYPSFNVKDLHTVDNGCIDHLLPSLYQEDWDVVIAHFLGVDHAGHIYGVDSSPMTEKLDQYNGILEKVIAALDSQSEPGGLHDNTLLLVMGDHGQTLNGDHGGGTAEEVETSLFAMSFKKPSSSVPPENHTSSHQCDMEKKTCSRTIRQLDFAVTLSALLGIPFPFGSIGHVNSELYFLLAGVWDLENISIENWHKGSNLEEWIKGYVNVLCINSWQVKRYIDIYSASSVVGFSSEDLLRITNSYAQAEDNWSQTIKSPILYQNRSFYESLPALQSQIDKYSNFLASVAELARSKWTEFNLNMMGAGIGVILISLIFHILTIKKVNKPSGISSSRGIYEVSLAPTVSVLLVVARACSFLSNSFILEEGKVANFLFATTGILLLRNSIMKKMMLSKAVLFLLLISILRFAIELGLSKQAATSQFMNYYPSWLAGFANNLPLWTHLVVVVPVVALLLLVYLLYRSNAGSSHWGIRNFVIMGTIISYFLIAFHLIFESNLWSLPLVLIGIGNDVIPQIIYAIGFGQLLLLVLDLLFKERTSDCRKSLLSKSVAMLSAWSSVIIILSGNQGPLVAITSIIGGYCILKLKDVQEIPKGDTSSLSFYLLPVTQWSLLAVCLFFGTGHWCAFDGLRYGAAFIGFEEFVLVRQAILLTIETFGFSHILSIFGLPLLVACTNLFYQTTQTKQFFLKQLSLVYLIYGIIAATTVTFTMICVSIHRRHLMVWGLFAPKFVFDVVGLILTDILIFLASIYYFLC